ncbi:hypothetical protein A1Q1_01968 [Trichosporon asahii var. asahii CBS 2479]|uniref:Uncharacterized protein n=1 Tax=Trichosporon asahii var. asahii (strain ATCC 90039 / CBS 2479 / JCM 2466 / KCTC 7840 / NBRC 103889/ NCYC 2677 / UAMH 7654) TaxID=1186058 RepID=J6EWK2_TRIAS|nr:hypothetical protein A1Q1_01968 [Trichosporon asahii var. asahii CBS 2479]EJT48979.1 hypothetical protein A1Q1_01968 [Trichosporon asahii var. asahii CBS 2479]
MRPLNGLARAVFVSERRIASARPPPGPSCSRWFSCTCCANDSRLRRKSVVHPRAPVPPIAILQQMQMPNLPLPPPLPWSPDSQPFLRHMHKLSIAILSESPDQSWEIYTALHPDMLKDVPDDVFSALLNHQLQADDSVKGGRLGDLLSLAAQCDMDAGALGLSLVEEALESALTSAARQIRGPGGVKRAIDYKTMDWLWGSLKNLVGDDLSHVSLVIRREWLVVSAFRHRNNIPLVHQKLEELIELGGGEGLDEQAGRIVSMAKHKSIDLLESSLRLAAWCLARNINIRPLLISRTIGHLRQAWKAQGEDGAERSQSTAMALAAELREGGADAAAAVFEGVVQGIVRKMLPVEGRVRMLADTASTTDDVYKVASGILSKDNTSAADLEALVKLCHLAMAKEGNAEPLIRRTVKQLASRPAELDHLVFKLADDVWSFSRNGGRLSPPLLTRIFDLVLACPISDNSYRAAYRLYPLVRAADPPEQHRWLHSTAPTWNRLFAAAVSRGQIFFASRLYADFQSDGLTVPKQQLLRLIERIAATETVSRAILLDRHVKDYLWDEAPPSDLITALVRGMSSTGSRSAVEGLRLAKRISPDQLPVAAIEAALPVLAASSHRGRRALAFALLKELPTDQARTGYERVLSALVKNSRAAGLEPVLAVVHDMFERGIPAAEKTSSLIISALLKNGQVDAGMATFRAAVSKNIALSSRAVGQLMVNLAQAGRCDDAYEVERTWRALTDEKANDKAVRGARLLVDIKAGRDVDLDVYTCDDGGTKEHAGYRPNRHYLNFLRKLRAPEPPVEAHAIRSAGIQPCRDPKAGEPRLATRRPFRQDGEDSAASHHGTGGDVRFMCW